MEGDRLGQLAARDGAVDQPGRGLPTCRDLGDGLGARLGHLRLVVGSELDQAVGVVEHERLAVPARVDEAVLVGEVGDVEVDDPGRHAQVAGVGA